MKKLYSLALISVFAFVLLSSHSDDNNDGKAGFTGAPGEQTCNTSGCHVGSAINSMGGTLEISSPDLVNFEYVPGQTYTISVTVGQAGRSLFGLCFEALKANGDNAGTLVAGAGTYIGTKMVSGFNRKSVTHNLNGGASADSHTFTFTWEAPMSNEGDITFYCTGNAANGNNSTSGDFIYSTSQVVSPVTTIGVAQIEKAASLEVFPNPFVDQLRMNFSLNRAGQVKADVFDISGRLVEQLINSSLFIGNYSETFDLGHLKKGQYFVHLSMNGEVITTKMIQK